jgi:hypothetical protein
MPRGGYRPGAGRPKGVKSKGGERVAAAPPTARPEQPAREEQTPLQYMLDVMNDPDASPERRDRMAIAAAGYLHGRGAGGLLPKGKREMARDAAHTAASGRYAPPAPPRLVVNNQ